MRKPYFLKMATVEMHSHSEISTSLIFPQNPRCDVLKFSAFVAPQLPSAEYLFLKVTCVLLFTLKKSLLSADVLHSPYAVLCSSPIFQTFLKHLTRYQNGNNLIRRRPYFQRNGLGFRYLDCNIISLISSLIKSSPAQFAIRHRNVFLQKLSGYLYSTCCEEKGQNQLISSHSEDFYRHLGPLLLTKRILKPFNSFIASLLELFH